MTIADTRALDFFRGVTDQSFFSEIRGERWLLLSMLHCQGNENIGLVRCVDTEIGHDA